MNSILHYTLFTAASLFAILWSPSSYAQCTFNSTSGYSVQVSVVPRTVVTSTSNCQWGYNYNISLDYQVVFSGTNAPASMYTLQGEVVCGRDRLFFNMNNTPGIGSATTVSNPWRSVSDCSTATPTSLSCTAANITVNGINLNSTTNSCNTLVALPVQFLNFSAERENNQVAIQWSTASETNNSHFEVQRMYENTWEKIGEVIGNGTSQTVNNYSFTDHNAPWQGAYYRLKQIDYDGKFEYSKIFKAQANSTDVITLWPNPARDLLTINCDLSENNYQISNSKGNNLNSAIQVKSVSSTKSIIDISELQSGVYFILIENKAHRFVKT